MTTPLVSFVVPTKNAARTIGACTRSLRAQTYGAVEIVVVDNDSTDATRELARDTADIVTTFAPERTAQRNRGAALGHGDILVFIDADMVVEPDVASHCVEMFASDPKVGSIVIPEVSFGTGFFARCRALEKQLYLGDDRVEAARAFRREAFERVGGYSEALTSFEDWELADRVRASGWRTGRIEARIHHDDGRISPLAQYRKKRYYGRESGRYLARRHSPRRRPLVRTSLFRRPATLARRPDLAAGLFYLKLCEAAGITIGGYESLRAHNLVHIADVPVPDESTIRVLHVVGEFADNEGIGRSMIELVARCPGEHHLLSARVGRGGTHFASAHAVGGSMSAFLLTRPARVNEVMARVRPDVVHFHGGPTLCLWAPLRVWRGCPTVASIYVWPRMPPLRMLRRGSWRAARRSQVLKARVVASTVVPGRVFAALLRLGRTRAVLTPDRHVAARLPGIDCHVVGTAGAAPDSRRARLDVDAPVIVFAGRAETVRGIDTLLEAIPAARARVPNLRVRLLLLDRAETDDVRAQAERHESSDAIEVITEPSLGLQDAFAAASAAVFPFKFPYVTIPPALTAAEAMAVGLPIIGTDVACLTAILRDGVNGRVVPINDAPALADAIVEVVTSKALWSRLSQGAVRTIAEADGWHSVADAAAQAYGIASGDHAVSPARDDDYYYEGTA
ncbi:MAG TPA: glycosyltransferase [Acidimicrobiia bacterium]